FFCVDIERRDLLWKLGAGIAVIIVRQLNDAHIEKHLALSIEEIAHDGVEGVEGFCRSSNGYCIQTLFYRDLLRGEDVLRDVAHFGKLRLGQAWEIDGF